MGVLDNQDLAYTIHSIKRSLSVNILQFIRKNFLIIKKPQCRFQFRCIFYHPSKWG